MKKNEQKIHNIAAKYILGENVNTTIKGNQIQLENLSKLLESSKKLYQKLNENNSSLDEILNLIEEKNNLADTFHKSTGITWKL